MQPAQGVNLVGYLDAELGIGEVARKIKVGLEYANTDFSTVTWGHMRSRLGYGLAESPLQRAPYGTNILCLNPDQLPIFREEAGGAVFKSRYSIGVWFWELSRFPRGLSDAFGLVDEVWVASHFVQQAVAAETSKPVRILPLPLEARSAPGLSRRELGLPEGFLFLFSFDFLSVFERKNPLALVEAFTRAFGDGEGPVLAVKSINGEQDRPSLERLHRAAASRGDIHVINRHFSPEEKDALMAACDCYVSLHRSEGFGLTMAEAMAYGKPVIATGYSGNLEFMTPENSHLVSYKLVAIPRGCEPYPVGGLWAEPDLDAAVGFLRQVYSNQASAHELGRRARKDVLNRFSLAKCAAFLSERLAVLATAR